MQDTASLTLKDWVSGAAFFLSLTIWIRTLWREKKEPKRAELKTLLDNFESKIEEVTAEVERHLLCQESRLNRVDILRQLRNAEKLFTKLEQRLPEKLHKVLRGSYTKWSRAMTEDPFPVENKKHRLKPSCSELAIRKEKEETLAQAIDAVRLKV
jgi:DUF438 domain-containing protein